MMIIDEHSAVLDTDFLSHISKINKPIEEIERLFITVLDELFIHPFVHPLVFEHEIPKDNHALNSFFAKKIVLLPSFEDLLGSSPEKNAYYSFLVSELYKKLTGHVSLDYQDVFSFWQVNTSLGEVHCIALCAVIGCSLFLSDDNGAKKLYYTLNEYCCTKLNIFNRKDLIEMLRGKTTLTKEERRAFAHV